MSEVQTRSTSHCHAESKSQDEQSDEIGGLVGVCQSRIVQVQKAMMVKFGKR